MLLLIAMSLIAPSAWGNSEGFNVWKIRLEAECTVHFTRKLEVWHGIARPNRVRLARTLCMDDRVFWPFAVARQPTLAPVLEETMRAPTTNSPLVIGISGPSIRENSEALHAIRQLLYSHSNTLLRWSYHAGSLENWRGRPEGGLFGGVVFVSVDESRSNNQFELQIVRARAALEYMSGNEMAGNVLAITAREDLRGQFADFPVRWVDFGAPVAVACEESIQN